MTPVFTATDVSEAHLIQGRLQKAGIPSEIRFGADDSIHPDSSQSPESTPEIWVIDDSQAGDAIETISSFQMGSAASTVGAPWQCPNCGEHLEAHVNQCWKCDTFHPAFL